MKMISITFFMIKLYHIEINLKLSQVNTFIFLHNLSADLGRNYACGPCVMATHC